MAGAPAAPAVLLAAVESAVAEPPAWRWIIAPPQGTPENVYAYVHFIVERPAALAAGAECPRWLDKALNEWVDTRPSWDDYDDYARDGKRKVLHVTAPALDGAEDAESGNKLKAMLTALVAGHELPSAPLVEENDAESRRVMMAW